jgi:hypothetical protein
MTYLRIVILLYVLFYRVSGRKTGFHYYWTRSGGFSDRFAPSLRAKRGNPADVQAASVGLLRRTAPCNDGAGSFDRDTL